LTWLPKKRQRTELAVIDNWQPLLSVGKKSGFSLRHRKPHGRAIAVNLTAVLAVYRREEGP
jgi:hypothetical protein